MNSDTAMTCFEMTPVTVKSLRLALLRWFAANARPLPWRATDDPYAIWISEIMLQQTQVATVVPYYNRFLERFPDVQSLAAARLDSVLKQWEGLGYYSRSRNLHKAAKMIVQDYAGKLPGTVEQLQKLPGIGRYTAGAIASIAFGQCAPVLDGNVVRVLCRICCVERNPKLPQVQTLLWKTAHELVCTKQPGDFNEAMMELGATLCTPKNPQCIKCPLQKYCIAKAGGNPERLPVKVVRPRLPHYTIVAGIVLKGDKILIDKRKADGLLGGLWEFPGGKKERSESFKDAVVREVKEETGVDITVGKRLCIVHHTYSHFKITLHAYLCDYNSGTAKSLACAAVKWLKICELNRFTFPAANTAIIRRLKKHLEK